MESNKFSEVPPPKIQRTDVPQESMQSLFSTDEIFTDVMNSEPDTLHDGIEDDEVDDPVIQLIRECAQLQLDFSASFRNTLPFKANTIAANFDTLSAQIKSSFEMSRLIITILSFSMNQTKQVNTENKEMKTQILELQKRVNFLQDQNARLIQQSNNILKKTSDIFDSSREKNNMLILH
jgi:hypothetical protein